MKLEKCELEGVVLIRPVTHADERGFFRELYHRERYGVEFVQTNHSLSRKGTIRGMHFQRGQAKLVSVARGRVYDVVVDLRSGRWMGVYLDGERGEQLFVPDGFAHGFCAVSEEADVIYELTALYQPEREQVFRYDDGDVGIVWPVEEPILSARDRAARGFREVVG